MAGKRITSGSEEFEMFKAFWKLYQDYYEPEEEQKYWDELVERTNRFYESYSEFPIAKYMVSSLIDCFEEKSKVKK